MLIYGPVELNVFQAVSDPTRREMLQLLLDGEKTAAELAQPFDVSQPAISQHLRVLREAGLVEVRKEGRYRVYTLNPVPLQEVFDWAEYFQGFWRTKLAAFARELDRTP